MMILPWRCLASHALAVVVGGLVAWLLFWARPWDATEMPAKRSSSAEAGIPSLDGLIQPRERVPRQAIHAASPGQFELASLNSDAFWNDPHPVTPGDAERFLDAYGHNAVNLVVAAQLTGEARFLQEAMASFPEDPQVQLAALGGDLSPKERDRWTLRFKEAQPDNAMASYYMAMMHLRQGNNEHVLAALREGAALSFDSLTATRNQAMEELLVSSDFHPLAAKFRSTFETPPGIFAQWSAFAQPLLDLAKASDPDTAMQIATAAVAAGNHLSQGAGGETIVNQLVGMAIETMFLEELPPDAVISEFSATPAELLKEVNAQHSRLPDQTRQAELVLKLDEAQATQYIDRVRRFGQLEAMQWLESLSISQGRSP